MAQKKRVKYPESVVAPQFWTLVSRQCNQSRAVAVRTENKIRTMVAAEKETMETAVHEAGHAVLASLLRQPFKHASLAQETSSHGHVWLDLKLLQPRPLFAERNGKFVLNKWQDSRERVLERLALIACAGVAATGLWFPRNRRLSLSGHADLEFATHFAMDVFGDADKATEYVRLIQDRVRPIITERSVYEAIRAVAVRLIAKKRLTAKEIRETVKMWCYDDETRCKSLLKHQRFHFYGRVKDESRPAQ